EATEPRRGAAGGGCGGKAVDQGEHATVQPVPDTEPGERAKRAGACARNCTEEREAEVHRPAAPCNGRTAAGELLRSEKAGSARSGWRDVGRIWRRLNRSAYRSAWPNSSWGLSSAAVAKSLDTETRRKATTVGSRGAGRQGRPARGGKGSQPDMGRGLSGLQLRVPPGARITRCFGRAVGGDRAQESELDRGPGYPILFRQTPAHLAG